ncbi:hypothetical protein L291_2621 [Acinetobacter guillouiae MSP4-18]|nr:hypothetical protein L291_2621 [Acinetobacter guillouiae MSP4-18]
MLSKTKKPNNNANALKKKKLILISMTQLIDWHLNDGFDA